MDVDNEGLDDIERITKQLPPDVQDRLARIARLDFYILNDDGSIETINDVLDWSARKRENNQIAADIRGNFAVSTIFLGIDHGHGLTDKPLLFETMIFYDGKGGHLLDRRILRYSTLAEAKAGHHAALKLVQFARKAPRKMKKALKTRAWKTRGGKRAILALKRIR